jgi:outer membrane protein
MGTETQFILQMKAILNLDAATPFDVVVPPVDMIPVEPLADLLPETVYASAMANLPQQKVNELRVLSAKKFAESAKGQMYPSLNASGSLYTNYVSFKDQPVFTQTITGYTSSGLRANVGGTFYDVERPILVNSSTVAFLIKPDPFGRQLKNNFGQNIGISLNVPIFNGRAARTNWERAKLNITRFELQHQQDDMQLKQDIYTAYNDAMVALQKFNADKRAVATAETAYDFAKKRYDLNLLSSFELITSQTNLETAKYQALYSQYDYLFKIKLLEFYKGQGLKL